MDSEKERRYSVSVESFNELAELYHKRFHGLAFYQPTFDRFLELLSDNCRLLEVACGPGNVTSYVLEKNATLSVLGIDLAPRMIELAKEINPQASYRVLDARRIGEMTEDFDAVMSAFLLPYIDKEDTLQHLEDVAALLEVGGLFYLSAIEGDYATSTFKSGSTGRQVFMHYYDCDFLTQELEESGFEILDFERKQFPEPEDAGDMELFFYCRKVEH
ncbi:MAG: class I SAM-dependent methyltransferase [Planctomycetota bacterium]